MPTIGKRNNHFMEDWQRDNGLTDEQTAAIEKICYDQKVDLGVALNIWQTENGLPITHTTRPSKPVTPQRPNEE